MPPTPVAPERSAAAPAASAAASAGTPAAPGPSSARPRAVSSRPAELAGELRVALTLAVRRIRLERSAEHISDGQYAVLARLSNLGPLTPSALAELEHVQPPPMSRTINALVEAGLVRRDDHPSDGRQVLVCLTDAGAAEVKETRRRRNAWLAKRLAALEPSEREVLAQASQIIRRITSA